MGYILKSILLAILCAVFALTAFACPWYLASDPNSAGIFGMVLLGSLTAIIYIIYSLRKSVIKDTGSPQTFNSHTWVGILIGIIIAVIKWKWDLQARGVREIYNSDIAELLMLIVLFCVLGFIGSLFIGLIRNKKRNEN